MIQTHDLVKTYRNETSICYRDMNFETGKSYMLLGASGCGKSTLLNMIAGILTPDSGSILLDGTDITKLSQREKDRLRIEKIGYIFQDFKLIEEMTVEDNIAILKLEKVNIDGLDPLLSDLGILKHKKKKVKLLSGGEKQRVAIARALVKKPRIILADEPTGNLNYAIGRKIMEELIRNAKGKTLICVTHDDRLAELFDEVIDMNTVASAMEGGEEHA